MTHDSSLAPLEPWIFLKSYPIEFQLHGQKLIRLTLPIKKIVQQGVLPLPTPQIPSTVKAIGGSGVKNEVGLFSKISVSLNYCFLQNIKI